MVARALEVHDGPAVGYDISFKAPVDPKEAPEKLAATAGRDKYRAGRNQQKSGAWPGLHPTLHWRSGTSCSCITSPPSGWPVEIPWPGQPCPHCTDIRSTSCIPVCPNAQWKGHSKVSVSATENTII